MRDMYGRLTRRSPYQHPYRYDPFCVFKDASWRESDDVLYSDRLYEWDSDKYDECCMQVWSNHGQYFSRRKPTEIERFLRLYYGNDALKLTGVEQHCNYSTGYPYWAFYVREEV